MRPTLALVPPRRSGPALPLARCLTACLAVLLGPGLVSAQVVEFYHLDALGNVRAVTDQAGAVIERHDYLPFGEECTTPPCAPVQGDQPKRFTGKERDAETGLDYFGARYYGSKTARFTSVDPAYTIGDNLVDPQRWNKYAYARNNPLRYMDPDGRLTIIVHGTWARGFALKSEHASFAAAESSFNAAVSLTFGEKAVTFDWSGGNSVQARDQAHVALRAFIEANIKEGEALNIVAHSHGGNVVKAYTQLKGARTIDTLVNLGTPQRPDYQVRRAGVLTYINIYDPDDPVQANGGELGMLGGAGRIDRTAQNLGIDTGRFGLSRHGALHEPSTWETAREYVTGRKRVPPIPETIGSR